MGIISTKHERSNLSFLDLPPEIRVMIYTLIAIPHDAAIGEFKGLYLSCHKIKTEMDYEIPKVFHEYLLSVQRYWEKPVSLGLLLVHNPTAIHDLVLNRTIPKIFVPTTFGHIHRLKLQLPNTILLNNAPTLADTALLPITGLCLESLELEFYNTRRDHTRRNSSSEGMMQRFVFENIAPEADKFARVKVQKIILNPEVSYWAAPNWPWPAIVFESYPWWYRLVHWRNREGLKVSTAQHRFWVYCPDETKESAEALLSVARGESKSGRKFVWKKIGDGPPLD